MENVKRFFSLPAMAVGALALIQSNVADAQSVLRLQVPEVIKYEKSAAQNKQLQKVIRMVVKEIKRRKMNMGTKGDKKYFGELRFTIPLAHPYNLYSKDLSQVYQNAPVRNESPDEKPHINVCTGSRINKESGLRKGVDCVNAGNINDELAKGISQTLKGYIKQVCLGYNNRVIKTRLKRIKQAEGKKERFAKTVDKKIKQLGEHSTGTIWGMYKEMLESGENTLYDILQKHYQPGELTAATFIANVTFKNQNIDKRKSRITMACNTTQDVFIGYTPMDEKGVFVDIPFVDRGWRPFVSNIKVK